MTILTISDSGPLKRDIIEMAFEECGSAGYEFERDPEEVKSALRKLNAMMREWPWNTLGYVQGDYAEGQPAEFSGIPEHALSAVSGYLALRIAPAMGASLSPEMKSTLSRSYSLVVSEAATKIVPTLRTATSTVLGSGRTRRIIFSTEEV